MVDVGDTAPELTPEGYVDGEVGTVTPSEVPSEGRPAVLAFYVYDFSPVCTDQPCELYDVDIVTLTDGATALGISTDGPYSYREFATRQTSTTHC